MNVFVERVPTAANVADLPSRQQYALLRFLNAKEWAPRLDREFRDPTAWATASARALFG